MGPPTQETTLTQERCNISSHHTVTHQRLLGIRNCIYVMYVLPFYPFNTIFFFFFFSFIYDLLERAHLNYSSKAAVSDTLEQMIGHLAGRQCG